MENTGSAENPRGNSASVGFEIFYGKTHPTYSPDYTVELGKVENGFLQEIPRNSQSKMYRGRGKIKFGFYFGKNIYQVQSRGDLEGRISFLTIITLFPPFYQQNTKEISFLPSFLSYSFFKNSFGAET